MDKNREIEILAPAGSFESLAAAAQGGAHAVYFGIEKMNMRARSSYNFKAEDLPRIVSFCREHGLKTYLTLNIVLYEQEIDEAYRIIDLALEQRIDALIATDIAVIQYARSKGMELHLSTQVNITNSESLKFYAGYADVMVLARELDLEQVKKIHDRIRQDRILGPSGKPVRLELFVHGALCMAVSGKCYMSLHEMDTSANRGECLQTCRKPYVVTNRETGYQLEIDNEYIMSPKDLMTIHFLNRILDAGVSVLKIEGRARGPEYVRTVTSCYREAVDAWLRDTYTEEKIEAWKKRLAEVFNRGFWDGYYLGQKLGEWSHRYGSRASMRKIRIGKITNYFARVGVAEMKLESGSLKKGEKILVIGPTTGVEEITVSGLRVDDREMETATKGMTCTFTAEPFLRRSDEVYRWVEARFVKQQ